MRDSIRGSSSVNRVSGEPAKSVPLVVDKLYSYVFALFGGVGDVVGFQVSVKASPLGNTFDMIREVVSGSSGDNSEPVILWDVLC